MLLAGGQLPDGTRLLSSGVGGGDDDRSHRIRGARHRTVARRRHGLGLRGRRPATPDRSGPSVGSYGWDGGLGSSWANDPESGLIGVVLTTDMFAGPFPAPAVIQDAWTGLATACAD